MRVAVPASNDARTTIAGMRSSFGSVVSRTALHPGCELSQNRFDVFLDGQGFVIVTLFFGMVAVMHHQESLRTI
jgi:hypothetical protein